MTARPEHWLTPEAYLALERKAATKSEYIDGMLVAMSGVTREHALITTNLVALLWNQLSGGPCEVYATDLRVRITEGAMYAYPDVVVVRAEPQFQDDEFDVLLNPTLIIEVLSESTEGYDRGLKFAHYRVRASLQEYVLVSQDRVSVERFSRRGEEWVFTEATNLDGSIELPSIGCTLALRDVYAKVQQVSGSSPPQV